MTEVGVVAEPFVAAVFLNVLCYVQMLVKAVAK